MYRRIQSNFDSSLFTAAIRYAGAVHIPNGRLFHSYVPYFPNILAVYFLLF